MIRITFILIFGLLFLACSTNPSNSSEPIPEMMQPDWTGIIIENLPVKFGQILKFNNDSIDLTAIVLDFSEDEGGQWIGLCLIDSNRLFGRQVPSRFINTTCLDLLDLTYIQKDALIDYKIVETIQVIKTKVGIGSQSAATNLDELKRDFNWGFEQRKKQQTPCNEGILDLNPLRECYFDIEKITK